MVSSAARNTVAGDDSVAGKFMRFLVQTLAIVLVQLTGVTLAVAATAQSGAILVVGDSLSAGYGIDVKAGWVKLLEERLQQQGYEYRVVNASVSGETTGGGRARLSQLLEFNKPSVVVLELGANDGLRGLPLKQVRDNLEGMIQMSEAHRARVVLVGMQMPPNYGEAYTTGFKNMYSELAQAHKLTFVPFLLEDVALDEKLMQADNLHPNAQGQRQLLDNVWPKLKGLLGARKNS